MPATKKKAQLDPYERRSIALLWAYNGSDLVLLTFLPDEQRFDEYCQANRKNFRVLNLGTWFTIKYQRYVKCETRINILDVSLLVGKPPLETRVMNAVVQLCVPFVCSTANTYTDQYTYKSSLGNILLRKSQGGGPKQLLIWCSLQTVAWWKDPMMEEIVREHTDQMAENGAAKENAYSTNDKNAAVEWSFKLNQALNNCETNKTTTKEDNSYKMDTHSDASSRCDSWGESLGEEIDVDPDFGATNGHVDDEEFVVTKKEEGGEEERINEKLAEESEWSHYDMIRSFDWENLNIGIVVEQIEMPKNEPLDTNLFSIFPLGTGERYPGILRLWTKQSLQTGHWISFRKSWSPFGSLNDGEYRRHPPMFRTLSFWGRVVVECEIIFPIKKGDEIKTYLERPQNHLPYRSSSPTPFIRYIEDEQGLIDTRFLGTRQWAVLEHVPMEWSPTKSWWKIVHVRPAEFDKFFRK